MKGALASIVIFALSSFSPMQLSAQLQAQSEQNSATETDDVAAAARAFQDGQKAQLTGNFAHAAELFELADELAPTPEAIRSAIRNREAAGQPARAATMALAAKLRYPDDAETITMADAVLNRVAPKLARLRVACSTLCTLLVDGEALTVEPVTRADAFVPVGAHRIEARFGAGLRAVEALELVPGEQRELQLRPPPPKKTLVPTTPRTPHADRTSLPSTPPPSHSGLSPWAFVGTSVLTLACGGAALVSGFDSLDKRDAYQAEPTRERYERGVESERRTNALLIGTGGLAAVSVALLAFTDWSGQERPTPRTASTLSFSPVAPNLVVRSTFP